ncbi:MAG: thioredoxin family protein [bacterium]|nr:thioredoxin family protein [bacterium]
MKKIIFPTLALFTFLACTGTSPEIPSGITNVVDYSAETLAEVQKNSTAILYFSAKWCPTCKAFNQELIDRNDDIPDGITIVKVDYDSETELRKKYDINIQHTLVQIDETGNEVKKWSGGGIDLLKQKLDL